MPVIQIRDCEIFNIFIGSIRMAEVHILVDKFRTIIEKVQYHQISLGIQVDAEPFPATHASQVANASSKAKFGCRFSPPCGPPSEAEVE